MDLTMSNTGTTPPAIQAPQPEIYGFIFQNRRLPVGIASFSFGGKVAGAGNFPCRRVQPGG
jgi:hypothetical protein